MDDPSPDTPERPFRAPDIRVEKPNGGRAFVVGPGGAYVQEGGQRTVVADAVDMFWLGIATDPAKWTASHLGYEWVMANAADASREDLRRALNWLAAAIASRKREAAVAAARYLALVPLDLLQADYARLVDLLNSRIAGMAWTITPDFDVKPLPPVVPRFGMEAGFGLLRSAPELYEKLAMLGPEMEIVVEGLVAETLRYGQSLPPALMAMAPRPAARE